MVVVAVHSVIDILIHAPVFLLLFCFSLITSVNEVGEVMCSLVSMDLICLYTGYLKRLLTNLQKIM